MQNHVYLHDNLGESVWILCFLVSPVMDFHVALHVALVVELSAALGAHVGEDSRVDHLVFVEVHFLLESGLTSRALKHFFLPLVNCEDVVQVGLSADYDLVTALALAHLFLLLLLFLHLLQFLDLFRGQALFPVPPVQLRYQVCHLVVLDQMLVKLIPGKNKKFLLEN